MGTPTLDIEKRDQLWIGRFHCMASPCEILVECAQRTRASELLQLGHGEALRIEQKFSRYRDDNIVYRINHYGGRVEVDAETARLLDFASHCHQLSDGLFDITSGALRQAWNYQPGSKIPTQTRLAELLPRIGWHKIQWSDPFITLPEGMEIDFGGIGKEYAVDSIVGILQQQTDDSFMVNLGGDCHANQPLRDGRPWMTGIEDPNRPGDAAAVIQLKQGALATSGDVFRFIEEDGRRYGHILNPVTGWPDTESPLSVTVAAATCTEAGILSTLAMLQGCNAEQFLSHQEVKFWCYR